ncbi:MAG: helix-turn-helix transcriptional regulator [Mariprofundales bacterium]
MNVQIIENNGQPEYAVLPYADFTALMALAEEAADIQSANNIVHDIATGNEEVVSSEFTTRLLKDGASPLREWRKYRGITQSELSTMVGVSQTAIGGFECGTKRPSVTTLRKLADALRLSADDLLVD